jgi:hypothetical protein
MVLTPVEMVEKAMALIDQAAALLEEAVRGHPVERNFQLGMINQLKLCTTPSDNPNRGTLPLLIKVLNGERKVPLPRARPTPKLTPDTKH